MEEHTGMKRFVSLAGEGDRDLFPLLEGLDLYQGRTPQFTMSDMFEMARTAIEEAGVNLKGAIAIPASFLPDDAVLFQHLKDQAITRITRGIKAVYSLNTKKANIQSENFMKLLLLLSEDMQALLAMIGIRLWQLRNFTMLGNRDQEHLVADLEHLYVPLVHRLGFYKIKSEMEDFVMQQVYPEIYRSISKELRESENERQKHIESFIAPINVLLTSKGFSTEIKYRVKSISSIWRKMQAQKVGVGDVYDVFAIRVIDQGPEETGKVRCWEIYSLITDLYKPDPTRLRDWISVPRPSGYESLHTTVLGPGNQWFEVQIRTRHMDEMAELGPAAHWRYKTGKKASALDWPGKARKLIEKASEKDGVPVGEKGAGPITDEIFTITPAGDLVRLRAGATVLDFAFDVHTEVGLRCKGAKVNGRIMPIRHRLYNGDKVEILTSTQYNVAEDWLKIVITTKAKNRIKRALKEKKEKEFMEGKELLERKLRQWRAGTLDEHVSMLMQHFRVRDTSVFYRMIASDKISASQIREALEARVPAKPIVQEAETAGVETEVKKLLGSDDALLINDEIETRDYHLAQCCRPVHGDEIFGFVTVGKGIKIHRENCPNAHDMKSRYPYRVISCQWMQKPGGSGFTVPVSVSGKDQPGIVNAITEVILNDRRVVMRSINMESERGKFKGTIRLYVKDSEHLAWVLKRISQVEGVKKVTRIKEGGY